MSADEAPRELGLPETRDEIDRALLKRIGEGDRTAVRELYQFYYRPLTRFLSRFSRRYELAEDVINDTFCVVWQRARDFRGESRFSTWLFGIAYRRALKAWRREAPLDRLDSEGVEEPADLPAERIELQDWLGIALERLPLEQRMVLELAYQGGHSCEEIAAIVQCPVNTVKTRMFHARRKLRGLLTALAGMA